MNIAHLEPSISEKYDIYEKHHALTILKHDFPKEYEEIISLLNNFTLTKEDILTAGGRKSPIASKLDQPLYDSGWVEKQFLFPIYQNGEISNTGKSHLIDCFKNRIGLEIEWNNKDTFYYRDLSNFRKLHEIDAISVAIIITRSDELQELFKRLDKGKSYGASTTHLSKLKPHIDGGNAGGCPILVFSIKPSCYTD